jgi:hypothetical protein
MATNQYFNKFAARNEQTLVQDLVDEAIKIHGVDMVYIPRTVENTDDPLGDAKIVLFSDARDIEMYVENYEGFEGEGEIMGQFGLEIKDEMVVAVSGRRFKEVFSHKNYTSPREGDLIFFPLNKSLFEINFVEREKNFFSFGKTFTFEMRCSFFKYTGEDFTSGFDAIDGVTMSAFDQLLVVGATAGTGEFRDGERGHLYTDAAGSVTGATIDIIEWDTNTDTATIRLINGTTVGATCMRGDASGASFGIHTIGLTQEYFAKDGLEDNTEIDFEAASFLDFTEKDPFSEGNF